MGVYYTLANLTKKERISFHCLPVAKKREIAGNPAASAVVAWYLLNNSGDKIGFIPDELESPFEGVTYSEISTFTDRTKEMIQELIENEILMDCGFRYEDREDPENNIKDIRNAWMPVDLLVPKKEY